MGRLVYCRDCGQRISKNAVICPNCGAYKKRTTIFGKIVLVWIIMSLIGLFGNLLKPNNKGKSTETSQVQTKHSAK